MTHATSDHPTRAAEFVENEPRTTWHDQALWFVRAKRDKAAHALPEWETLREKASLIKQHTASRLADYLEQFEENASRLGARVHWAGDAEEHNRIVLEILQQHGVRRLVKSKSMLTEECHLNPHLEQHGIEVIDTDLGERIVQLRREPPSHIVLPAIHIKKEEVGQTFHEHLGTEEGASDPNYLTEAARGHLREKFLAAEAGITGVNFAVAETGGVVVCTNEGNADLGVSLPKLHIACVGIEKLIPRAADLGVFLRLLARSATGQPITAYTSHFHGPIPGGELHIVLVDNGRSEILGSDEYRRTLNCIRCGACMNTCPVYRRSGGYSYNATIPGPIGSVLGPLRDAKEHYTLPYACSLCGSCTDVCPVKIPLHHQLYAWRGEIARRKLLPWRKRMAMKLASIVLRNTWLYNLSGKLARLIVPRLPRFLVYNRLNAWGKQRELPVSPAELSRDVSTKGMRSVGTVRSPRGELGGFSHGIGKTLNIFRPELWDVVWLSLRVSGTAVVISSLVGIPMGAWFGLARFRGKAALLAIIYTGMALPPVVVGLVLYMLLSRSGPLGVLEWLYTAKAMILAQTILSLPFVVGITMTTVAAQPADLALQVRSLGASRRQVWWTALSESRHGVYLAVATALGRSISEVGAVLIVGGNIDGHTRVLTTAIVLETSRGQFAFALALGAILLGLALLINVAIMRLRDNRLAT